jgi:hypothetical protein
MPSQVALSVVRAIRDRRAVVDVSGYLALFYLFFALAPGVLRWLTTLGGSGRREYGQVEWHYAPKDG